METCNMIQISVGHVDEIKKWFFSYVQNFKHGNNELNRNSILKENHTIRVCNEILLIGKFLELNADELHLAEISALFHDIGRFEQYARYQTFVDEKSVNHALLGVEILEENKVLKIFDESIQNLILRLITYHNRAALPENETEKCLFHAKLLRDADKLDIWRVVTDYYRQKTGPRNMAIELDLPDTPGFSDQIYQALMSRQIIDFRHIKNLNDFKLLQVGWIFDVNFGVTLSAVKSRHYLDMIQESLPESEKIQNLFTAIKSYLSENINIQQFHKSKQTIDYPGLDRERRD